LGLAGEGRDRRDVADNIEIELLVKCSEKRSVDRAAWSHCEERMAVRRRAHDRLRADRAAGARPVLDDEGLAEPFRQPLSHRARHDVGRRARRHRHDPAHWPRRIRMCLRKARHRRQRGSTCGQLQKSSTAKLHDTFLFQARNANPGMTLPRGIAADDSIRASLPGEFSADTTSLGCRR